MPLIPLISQLIASGGLPVIARVIGGVLSKKDGPLKEAGDILLSHSEEVNKLSGRQEMQLALKQLENEAAETEGNFELLIEQQKTQRSELASSSSYVRNWRPTWGYATCFAWIVQMAAMTYAVIATPELSAGIIASFAGLGFMWAAAFAVVGVSVGSRSKDKKLQMHSDAGTTPTSLIETLMGKLNAKR